MQHSNSAFCREGSGTDLGTFIFMPDQIYQSAPLVQAKTAPLKRAEVIEAARDAGQGSVVDNLYGKVMKDLCTSKSAQWTLKSGEPWEL